MATKPSSSILGLPRNQRGNVLMIAAFAMMPMAFGTGMVVDYSQAARLQTKMNAIADAAALSTVTTSSMKKTAAEARAQALNVFKTQTSGLQNLIFDPDTQLTVTVSDKVGASSSRTTVVTYSARSSNIFGSILRMPSIAIGGTSESGATQAPNIDFYLLIDTSPSMAIPATKSGIAAMINATKSQGDGVGCAFACHQTSTSSSDPGGTKKVDGKYVDNYYIAKTTLNLTLRMDLVQKAVVNLTDTATDISSNTGAAYRFAISQFDVAYNAVQKTPTSSANAKTAASKLTMLTVCKNNQVTCGINNNDQDTDFTTAFDGSLKDMPLIPGNGTNQSGDNPQAMLFLITDGMRDENRGGRKLGPIPTSQCDTIKARGIRIAVLYTEYLYESANDAWSISNVRNPYLSSPEKISPALSACASPGLFYQVTSDDDISAALAKLFQKAIASAHLTK